MPGPRSYVVLPALPVGGAAGCCGGSYTDAIQRLTTQTGRRLVARLPY